MVPDPINMEVASYTLNELLFAVPEAFGLKTVAQRISICLLDDIVRVSMLFVILFLTRRNTLTLNIFFLKAVRTTVVSPCFSEDPHVQYCLCSALVASSTAISWFPCGRSTT